MNELYFNNQTSIISELSSANDALEHAVTRNLGEMGGYTELERRAIIEVEKLRYTSQFEFKNTLLRGMLLENIDTMSLYSIHPNQYKNLEEMAVDVGISKTALGNTLSLYSHIFPYLQNHLMMTKDEIWGISKSNINEIIPHLRMLITDRPSTSKEVCDSVNGIIEKFGDKDIAIKYLIEMASMGTNLMLRKAIRPDHTPPIPAISRQNGTYKYLIMKLTEDQWIMLQRVAGKHLDIMPGELELEYLQKIF